MHAPRITCTHPQNDDGSVQFKLQPWLQLWGHRIKERLVNSIAEITLHNEVDLAQLTRTHFHAPRTAFARTKHVCTHPARTTHRLHGKMSGRRADSGLRLARKLDYHNHCGFTDRKYCPSICYERFVSRMYRQTGNDFTVSQKGTDLAYQDCIKEVE
ncbi:hypothetical protein BDP27DRAFT_1357372 [Rhodocollybia butyracea]|uniref:Uncharacterized protein n=1 Tax=Rhodocollybia butyracea TaxID=206335 RepID=A0A9P5UGA5_9AGAR|nr:hypothetical protein BDP27DRAFT_1357372 [Rhodocollybia butyracea]